MNTFTSIYIHAFAYTALKWRNRTLAAPEQLDVWLNMFHKNGMSPTIRTNCTICHSILYSNSRAIYHRLKYLYQVISVKLDLLHANTKHMAIEFCSWATRVGFLHSWAVHADIQMRMYMHS